MNDFFREPKSMRDTLTHYYAYTVQHKVDGYAPVCYIHSAFSGPRILAALVRKYPDAVWIEVEPIREVA